MKLSHHGLRAADRAHELGKLNLFRGPVGSGKSTVLDAVALAALGYVPRVGRSEAATRRLIRGERCAVDLVLDDGRTIARELERNPGSRAVCRLSWAPKAKLTEAQNQATGLFGATQEEAEQNLDTRQLLLASPRERAKLVEAMLDGAGTAEGAADRSARLIAARLAGVTEDRVPAEREAQRTLSGSPVFDEVADAVAAVLKKNGFSLALEEAKDRKNSAAADARTKTAARGAIEDRRLAIAAPAESEQKLRERRDAAHARRVAAETSLVAEANQARNVTAAEEQRDAAAFAHADAVKLDPVAMRAQAAELRAQADAILDPAPPPGAAVAIYDERVVREAAALRERAAELTAAADAIEIPAAPARLEVEAALRHEVERMKAEATALRGEARLTLVPAEYSTDSFVAEIERAKAFVEHAEESPWREVEAIADEVEECGRAYGDGTIHQHAIKLRRLAARHGGDLDAAKRGETQAREAHQKAQLRAAEIRDQIAIARRRIDELGTKAQALEQEAGKHWSTAVAAVVARQRELDAAHAQATAAARERVAALRGEAKAKNDHARKIVADEDARVAEDNRRLQAAAAEAERAWKAVVTAHTDRRRELRQRAAGLESDAASTATRIADATEKLSAAEARLAGLRAAVYDVPALRRTVDEAARELTDLDEKLKACGEAAARKREMAALVAEIDRADALRAAWAAAEDALRRLRDEDVRRRAGPLEARMREFLRGAGRAEEPYVRCEGGVTDFGWCAPDGAEVSLDGALSGGESVLMLTALAVAVVGLRAPAVRVLLIEAAELHGDDAAALLRGCAAVAEQFDAVLVAGPASLPALDGWMVFDVEREAAQAA